MDLRFDFRVTSSVPSLFVSIATKRDRQLDGGRAKKDLHFYICFLGGPVRSPLCVLCLRS